VSTWLLARISNEMQGQQNL